MCQSIANGGARCAYHKRNSELRNASARLRTVLKKLEKGGLAPEEYIEAIATRDQVFNEQQELYEEADDSLPEGWQGHLTENIYTDLKQVNGLAEGSDVEGLEEFIEERTESEEFVTALNTRDALIAERDERRERYQELKEEHKENGGSYEDTRQAALELLDTNENLSLVRNELDEYRAITAQAAAHINDIREEEMRADGTFVEYDEDSLGDLVTLGQFPEGSREWLESRQGGIGGSDVGAIMRADEEWGSSNYRDVLRSKVEPITDEQVEEQTGEQQMFNNAASRGNAWEGAILHKFSDANPDITVAHCKSSWNNEKAPFQYANFDGLMLDENGVPDGIVEIKTGSIEEDWGKTEDGIDGIPPGYRAQVLWYMQAAHLKRGAVAVMINDREYREYHWKMTPELEAEQARNFDAAQEFWNEAQDRKANPENYEKIRRAGFPQSALKSGYKWKETTFRSLAAYREESEDQIKQRFETLLPNEEDRSDREKVDGALRTLYTEYDPANRSRPIVGLDIETSSTSPLSGRILEMGMTVRTPDGKETTKVDQLHGLSDKSRRGNGAGATHIHNINLSDVAGKPAFDSDRNQKRVLSELKNSGVMLAHNAHYEDSWLKVHLKGYADARSAGEISVLDTMNLSRHLLPDAKSHSLKAFVEHNEGDYTGAHRAYRDAEMMTDAFFKFQDEIGAKKN